MSNQLTEYTWYDYKNYQFVEQMDVRDICRQVLYRHHVIDYINLIKDNNLEGNPDGEYLFKEVNNYLETLQQGQFKSFRPTFDPFAVRDAVENLRLFHINQYFAVKPQVLKTLDSFCLNEIYTALTS